MITLTFTLPVLSKKQKIILGFCWALFIACIFSRGGKVYANCGVNTGDHNDYAGVIIDVQWKRYSDGTWQQANNVSVRITADRTKTLSSVAKTGNKSQSRTSAVFKQFQHNCNFSDWGGKKLPGDKYGIVLGYGATSTTDDGVTGWALDCELSYYKDGTVQSFLVEGIGTPDGARSNGTWNTFAMTANNGQTAHWVLEYLEGPPQDGGGGGDFDAALGIFISGYSGSVTMSQVPSSDGVAHDVGTCGNRGAGITSFTFQSYKLCPGYVIGPIGMAASSVSNYDFLGWAGCDSSSGNVCYMEKYESGTKYVSAVYKIRDNYYPSFSLNATCDTISISGLTDSDNGGSIPIRVYIDGSQVDSRSTRGSFSIALPKSYQEDGLAHTISATATSIAADGSANSSKQTTNYYNLAACYKASCTITNPAANPIMDVKQAFDVTANIRNDGQVAWNNGNKRVTTRLAYNGKTASPSVPYTPSGFPINNVQYPGFTVANSINQQTLTVEVLLDGSKNIGSCSLSFDPYTDFVIKPIPRPDSGLYQGATKLDAERPDNFQFKSTATVDYGDGSVSGTPVTISGSGVVMTHKVDKIAYPSNTVTTTNGTSGNGGADTTSFAPPVTTMTVNIPAGSYTIGDKYCGRLDLTYSKGKVNRNGTLRGLNSPVSASPQCDIVVARPIFRVYGGDVAAGFDGCKGWSKDGDQTGDIIGWVKDATDITLGGAGAGTQLAAISRGVVRDFASSVGKTPGTFGPSSLLRFATNGNFGTAACPYDYWASANGDAATIGDVSTPGTHKYTGTYTIDNIAANKNMLGSRTIYVDGDVYIKGDVTFNVTNWSFDPNSPAPPAIPSFTLIAHGNIYIDKAVKNLDGLYIAQPAYNTATSVWEKGEIRTCVADASGTLPPATTYYEDCKSSLKVTGAFIANIVRMQRTKGTRYDSANSDNVTAAQNNTGEVFLFSPELWLRAPSLNANGTTKQFDSITSGAPVL